MHSMSGSLCGGLLDLQKDMRGVWVSNPLTQACMGFTFPGLPLLPRRCCDVFHGSSRMLSLPVSAAYKKPERCTVS